MSLEIIYPPDGIINLGALVIHFIRFNILVIKYITTKAYVSRQTDRRLWKESSQAIWIVTGWCRLPIAQPLSVWSISTFACQQEIFPKTWEHISNLDRELRRISLNKISIQQCWLRGEELETKRLLTARVEIQCLNLNSKKVYYNDVSQLCLSLCSSLISIKIFQIDILPLRDLKYISSKRIRRKFWSKRTKSICISKVL